MESAAPAGATEILKEVGVAERFATVMVDTIDSVAAGTVLQKRDLAHLDLELLADIPGDDSSYLLRGGSAIIAPNGDCLAGPLLEKPGFVTAVIDPAKWIDGRLTLDVMGHYGRPDVFQLHVNTTPQTPIHWQGAENRSSS